MNLINYKFNLYNLNLNIIIIFYYHYDNKIMIIIIIMIMIIIIIIIMLVDALQHICIFNNYILYNTYKLTILL